MARVTWIGAALLALPLALPLSSRVLAQSRRPLAVSDMDRLRDVRDPQRSPDGEWVAYSVTVTDTARDRTGSHLWMTSWDGARNIQLTFGAESESRPRWSPDGKWLAFLSGRREAEGTAQLWLLNRSGGEAQQVSRVKGDISDYAWSPDGARLVVVMEDPEGDTTAHDSTKKKTPRPIVIDRYSFKSDADGYLGTRRSHLYLFDIATRAMQPLTSGRFDEESPAWSPDGRSIAFVSKQDTGDVDRTENSDLFVVDATPGATPRRITRCPCVDQGPLSWSSDGANIAYLRGGDPKYRAYTAYDVAVVPASGGEPRSLTTGLDRTTRDPTWSPDGKWVWFLITDDRSELLARVPASGGAIERITTPGRVVSSLDMGRDGAPVVLASTDSEPAEVHAVDGRALRRLSHQNDSLLAELQLATTEDLSARSRDDTEVHGLVTKPLGYVAGRPYPTLLRIHGGPNGQDEHAFNFERQLFAANGYVVVNVNYRGSAGRGAAFSHAIYADWGNKEVMDLLGAMDAVQRMGLSDSARLGIGGWSYGGILTDYTIASDHRFRAGISGAGSALQLTMYGIDQYIGQYDTELGPPWKSEALWIKLSYPFFHADRITTPTLFLGGDLDFNVPVVGGEQMYQALRSLGVPTELVIYPGQHHGIARPSFKRDRLQRYLAWYARYLQPAAASRAAEGRAR